MIELIDHPNPYKLPCKFFVVPAFPPMLDYKGDTYHTTGKIGVVMKTGVPSCEYSCRKEEPKDILDVAGHLFPVEHRIWFDANENITED
jgi:hypothetical protein